MSDSQAWEQRTRECTLDTSHHLSIIADPDMQASDGACRISALYDDLLREIFLENTFPLDLHRLTDESRYKGPQPTKQIRPLTTARHCSQVCRYWRSISLSTPSIWARLIDLDGFRQTTDDWKKEVMARSGEALLWVYGNLAHDARDLFFSVVGKNWGRVEMLVIRASQNEIEQNHFGFALIFEARKMWTFLEEPAPHLQRFSLCRPWVSREYIPGGHLFGDNAPLLRDFSISAFRFRTDASWLPGLTSITFSNYFTLEDVLISLQRMPLLSSLTVHLGRSTLPANRQGPKVVLPYLRMLDLRTGTCTDTLNATTILQLITPSPDCCLATMKMLYFRPLPALDPAANEEYENAVGAYIVPYLSSHPPSCVDFSLDPDMLRLGDGLPPDLDRRRFMIMLYTPLLHFSSLIKELTNSTCFSHITKLNLDISEDYSLDSPANLTITAILTAFSNVKTLLAGEDTLLLLLEQPSLASALFPTLLILQISHPQGRRLDKQGSLDPPHQRFLNLRKAIGRPVFVLELKIGHEPWEVENMDHLEEHPGLLVRWKSTHSGGSREYVCGSGRPKKLRRINLVPELS